MNKKLYVFIGICMISVYVHASNSMVSKAQASLNSVIQSLKIYFTRPTIGSSLSQPKMSHQVQQAKIPEATTIQAMLQKGAEPSVAALQTFSIHDLESLIKYSQSKKVQTEAYNVLRQKNKESLYTKVRYHAYPHKNLNESEQDYHARLDAYFHGLKDRDFDQPFKQQDLLDKNKDDAQLRPLHIAIKSGHYDIIPYLVSKNVSVNATKHYTMSPHNVIDRDSPLDLLETYPKMGDQAELQNFRNIHQLLKDRGARHTSEYEQHKNEMRVHSARPDYEY